MKKLFIAGLIVLVLGAGVWLGRKPYKRWEHDHYLAQSQEAFGKLDYRRSVLTAQKALLANPNSPAACRMMALLLETGRSPQAISWRHRVLELEPNVVSNRLDLARTALVLGNYREADAALRGINETNRTTAEFHQAVAMLALAEKNLPLAEAHFAEAAKLEPQNKSIQFNLAVLHLQAKDPQMVMDAKASLEMLTNDPLHRRDALRHLALAELVGGELPKAEHFAEELEKVTPASFDDRILHLTILKQAGGTNLNAMIASTEAEAAKNPQELGVLSAWLQGHGMADEALKWLLSLPAKTQAMPTVAMSIVDCYSKLGEWTKARGILEDHDWGDLEFMRLALLARAERIQTPDFAIQSHWRAAITTAAGRLEPLSALVRMADAWGWKSEKEEVAWRLIQSYPRERWAVDILVNAYSAQGNTAGLQKLYGALMESDPADLAAKNNFAVASLLLHSQAAKAHQIARENYMRFPKDAIIVSTYAYSLQLQGRTQEGITLLEKFPARELEQPAVAVYYGLLLATDGQRAKAKKYLEFGRSAPLLPEETALIAQARSTTSSTQTRSAR